MSGNQHHAAVAEEHTHQGRQEDGYDLGKGCVVVIEVERTQHLHTGTWERNEPSYHRDNRYDGNVDPHQQADNGYVDRCDACRVLQRLHKCGVAVIGDDAETKHGDTAEERHQAVWQQAQYPSRLTQEVECKEDKGHDGHTQVSYRKVHQDVVRWYLQPLELGNRDDDEDVANEGNGHEDKDDAQGNVGLETPLRIGTFWKERGRDVRAAAITAKEMGNGRDCCFLHDDNDGLILTEVGV